MLFITEGKMNKNLVKELFDAFDNVKSQEELDKLKQEILNTINVCYRLSSNGLREKNKYSQIIIDEINFFKSILKKE